MKFGQEYKTALANEGFPQEWVQSAISYKHLKKVIKKIHRELDLLGLDAETLDQFTEWVKPSDDSTPSYSGKDFFASAQPGLPPIREEFSPQLRVLVDTNTGSPLDVRLDAETKASLRSLAQHQSVVAGRRDDVLKCSNHLAATHLSSTPQDSPALDKPAEATTNATGGTADSDNDQDTHRQNSLTTVSSVDAQWVTVPLASAKDFFDLLEPKLGELEALRDAETRNLEEAILDLGELVEDVIQPVVEGYEARRKISHRDVYFWREMFRLYLETPIFYSNTERKRGALTFAEAKARLEQYDKKLRETGLLAKMRTPNAKAAAKQFLDLNVQILKVLHFQEMNARAMAKILKKFNKQTHLGGPDMIGTLRSKYPAVLPGKNNAAGGFADSIARELQCEIASKVLAIVPQLDDWICPVCYSMAWRPVNLGCCRSVFCIRCIIHLQDEGMKKCPMCNAENVMDANRYNIDAETMAFLQKYFPMEVKARQKENERAMLIRQHGEEFVKPGCVVM